MPRPNRMTALMVTAALVFSLLNGCSARPGPAAPTQGDRQPASHSDAGQAEIADAASRGLPAVIKLGSDSCEPCRRMKPVMEDLAKHYGGKIVFLTVDVYKHPDLASKYEVQVIPKIIFVDPTGKAVAYIEGYQAVDQMKSLIEKSGILK